MMAALLQKRGTHHICVWVDIIGHVCRIILNMQPQKMLRDAMTAQMCHLLSMINQSVAHLFHKTLRLKSTNIPLSPKLSRGRFVCKHHCLNVFTAKFHNAPPPVTSAFSLCTGANTQIFLRDFPKLIEIFHPQY